MAPCPSSGHLSKAVLTLPVESVTFPDAFLCILAVAYCLPLYTSMSELQGQNLSFALCLVPQTPGESVTTAVEPAVVAHTLIRERRRISVDSRSV